MRILCKFVLSFWPTRVTSWRAVRSSNPEAQRIWPHPSSGRSLFVFLEINTNNIATKMPNAMFDASYIADSYNLY
ncbi:MAG: hypothetical protein CTY39_10875 [Hyphomicrobium sp.]|nr:MAG: hypothetical protein CTY39_10875 [Hyphomicrobium sp.]